MASLRNDLGQATSDDLPAIAAEAHRVRSTAGVQQRIGVPDPELPYFAQMQLDKGTPTEDAGGETGGPAT